jgi:hypothetical protein
MAQVPGRCNIPASPRVCCRRVSYTNRLKSPLPLLRVGNRRIGGSGGPDERAALPSFSRYSMTISPFLIWRSGSRSTAAMTGSRRPRGRNGIACARCVSACRGSTLGTRANKGCPAASALLSYSASRDYFTFATAYPVPPSHRCSGSVMSFGQLRHLRVVGQGQATPARARCREFHSQAFP